MSGIFHWMIDSFIPHYGYGAIFLLLVLGVVGLPVPDETLLVFCGYLISRGKMHPGLAWISALTGSWCGISVSYLIGRTLGLGFVHRWGKYIHVTEERLDHVHKWFDRIGHWALLVGYYIAGVRHFTAIVAGTSKLKYTHFIAYAWTGGLLWVTTFLTVGYYLGDNWQRISETIHHYILYISLVVIAAVLCYYLVRRFGTKIQGR